MRILVHSPAFLPQVGGLENHTAVLAEALAARSHEVTVWTTTPAGRAEGEGQASVGTGAGYRVARRPSWLKILRMARDCDVLVHQNVSLKGIWPLFFFRRPWVAVHHSWYCRTNGVIAWQDRLKRWTLRFADASIAVSQAVADDLATPTIVIPNPYRDDLFVRIDGLPRDADLIFVGRLVSDKGVDVLLEALRLLGRSAPRLTIVGDGPERHSLEVFVRANGLSGSVEFTGQRTGLELVKLLNRHKVLVVPSRYREPFGIVALEGIACGCVTIGTTGGGLPEAIGPCGILVPRDDGAAIASAIARLLHDSRLAAELIANAKQHLEHHTVTAVMNRYLAAFQAVVPESRTNA